MDDQSQQILAHMIRGRQTAALGTLRNGAPFVSMVPYAFTPDFTGYDIHISTLAHHTRDILADPRVSLMIAQPESPGLDAQALPRVSISGQAQYRWLKCRCSLFSSKAVVAHSFSAPVSSYR